jgi:hypothetical protein
LRKSGITICFYIINLQSPRQGIEKNEQMIKATAGSTAFTALGQRPKPLEVTRLLSKSRNNLSTDRNYGTGIDPRCKAVKAPESFSSSFHRALRIKLGLGKLEEKNVRS